MTNPKVCVSFTSGGDVVPVSCVMLVHLLQHAQVRPLPGHKQTRFSFPVKATLVQWNSWKSSESTDPGKLALLVNQSQQVAGIHSQEVNDFPIVVKSDVGPGDVFPLVLLLFLSEDVVHEELLQLLVRKVDQKLLEAARGSDLCSVTKRHHRVPKVFAQKYSDLFLSKFSNPNMSSSPMDREEDLGDSARLL